MMGLSGMGRYVLHASGSAGGASAMFNAALIAVSVAC